MDDDEEVLVGIQPDMFEGQDLHDLNRYATPDDTIQRGFEVFHQGNPQVYALLVAKARALKAAGKRRIGIAYFYEQIRWSRQDGSPEPFRLSNSYRSRYARLIMRQEVDLRGFFTLSELSKD